MAQVLYRVKEIVDKRLNNGVEEFLIRWEGYTKDADSWQKESDFVGCYTLILRYETTLFASLIMNDQPKIIGLRKDTKNRVKFFIEWNLTNTKNYFYSAAVRDHDPHIIINYYEKNVCMADQDEELTYFHNTISRSEEIVEDAIPRKIIAAANCNGEKLYLLSFVNEEEASIVNDDFVKTRCPSLLIKFYEKHIFVGK